MEPGATPRTSVAGFLVVLVGATGWVVGCFLPLYHLARFDEARITLFRQVSFGSLGTRVGGVIYLFGAISAIGVISILGVLKIRRWIGVLLAGAAIAWSLVSIGVLISIAGSLEGFNPGATLGIGYWCCGVSVVVVVAGTVMVLVAASRADVSEP
jgi:hypothetical protein